MNKWEQLFKKNNKCNNLEIKLFLDQLGFKPTFSIFNVVGTNGKGSTSFYLAQGFQHKFKNVGLFESPHIKRPNERISINNKFISDDDFFKIYNLIQTAKFNFFSFLFVVAMLYFQKQKCDVVILEAGIGGWKDNTNIFPGTWGVITSIGLDHVKQLGHTKKNIAWDKSQIININMLFYLPLTLEWKYQNIFIQTAKKKQAQIIKINNNGLTYKKQNQKLATNILKHCLKINVSNFIDAPNRTKIFLHNNLTTIFDVAHNYAAIKASLHYLKTCHINFEQVVIALTKTKLINGINALFKNKNVFIWQYNKNFYNDAIIKGILIKDIQFFYNKQNKTTLYIGSFKLIGAINE